MNKNELVKYQRRIAWYNQARFGMFIHWGLYALLSRECWVMDHERIPAGDYAALADQFNPRRFHPDSWVALAKRAGMKYMVLTARHHDGFCLFDSRASDFTSVKTAAGRDIVDEYVTACRRGGMRVGLYYSLLDWRFPGYFNRKKHPESFKAMVAQLHDQVRELMTNYGKIDYLFYDGEWIPGVPLKRSMLGNEGKSVEIEQLWRSRELNRMVRRLQPHITINNRAGIPEDVDTPEQGINASRIGRAWETCMTIGDCWGHIKYNPNIKSVTQLIQYLVTVASGGGNFLLNVGPKPDGAIQKEFVNRLEEIGRWMKVHGESVYESERVPLGWGAPNGGAIFGCVTGKAERVYLHYFRWPGEKAVLTGVKNKIVSARILTTGQKVDVVHAANGRIFLTNLPERPPDVHDTVITLKLDGKPKVFSYQGMPL